MGRAGKGRRADIRKKQKRARKDANRARFEAMRDSGSNSKDKSNAAASRDGVRNVRHRTGDCGNVGCKRCSPTAIRMEQERLALAAKVRELHLRKLSMRHRFELARRDFKRRARAEYYKALQARKDAWLSGN